jgi:hypothetical protein
VIALWGYGGDFVRTVAPRTEWVYGDGKSCKEICSSNKLEPIDLGVLSVGRARRHLCVGRWLTEGGARAGSQDEGEKACHGFDANEPLSNFACLCANRASGPQYPFGVLK